MGALDMALKWWPQANWTRTIAELFSELRGELTSLQPMDSKDIRWNKTANGMEALLVESPRGAQAQAEEPEATGNTGESYTGFFKAVGNVDNTDPENPVFKVKVFDGAVGEESTDAGPALINNQRLAVATAEVEVSFGINYIFMTSSISGGVISTPAIANYSSFNDPSLDGACAVLIATAYVFAGEVQVHQQQHGAITAFIWGEC